MKWPIIQAETLSKTPVATMQLTGACLFKGLMMQLIADRIEDLSAHISSYSDQYNWYTVAHMVCPNCKTNRFNLFEKCFELNCHYSVLLECLECKYREEVFDNMTDGYDGACIFNESLHTREVVEAEKLISTGEVKINFTYQLEFDQIVKTAELHNTKPGNLFHSISFEMRHDGSSDFLSVWDAETA